MSTDIQTANPAQVLAVYYELLGGGISSFDPKRLRAILADDLAFEGPIAGARVGADGFVRGASGFAGVVRRIDLLQQVTDEDGAATLYDAELPGGTVRFAEFFQIAGGKIRTLRLHYDAAAYRAHGGQ